MRDERGLRRHLAALLHGHGAHVGFDEAVRGFPTELRGKAAGGTPHSGWQILEHLRIALWDIVEYSRKADHVSPPWPDGYWPAVAAPPHERSWDRSVAAYRRHRREMGRLVDDAKGNLLKPLPWSGGDATLLRMVFLAADHAAYHVGQLVTLRQLLGAWPPAKGRRVKA
jgi:DinB family protein